MNLAPGKKGFAIWLKCLKEFFNMQSNKQRVHSINQFGKWIPEYYQLQNKCHAHYQEPLTQHAFRKDNDSFLYFTYIANRSACITCNRNLSYQITSLPKNCFPAESCFDGIKYDF